MYAIDAHRAIGRVDADQPRACSIPRPRRPHRPPARQAPVPGNPRVRQCRPATAAGGHPRNTAAAGSMPASQTMPVSGESRGHTAVGSGRRAPLQSGRSQDCQRSRPRLVASHAWASGPTRISLTASSRVRPWASCASVRRTWPSGSRSWMPSTSEYTPQPAVRGLRDHLGLAMHGRVAGVGIAPAPHAAVGRVVTHQRLVQADPDAALLVFKDRLRPLQAIDLLQVVLDRAGGRVEAIEHAARADQPEAPVGCARSAPIHTGWRWRPDRPGDWPTPRTGANWPAECHRPVLGLANQTPPSWSS